MKSTRQQIIDLLDDRKSATARELSRILLVSAADVRHHLAALRREGLVETVKEEDRPPSAQEEAGKRSAGRPAQRYRLSTRARLGHFDRLAEALLEEVLEGIPPQELQPTLQRIAARMAGPARPSGSLANRLVQAVQRLNQLHYEASWEARPGDPQVRLGRCPYAGILPQHPELCLLDAELLETMLGTSAVQTARQARDASGTRYCRFVISVLKK